MRSLLPLETIHQGEQRDSIYQVLVILIRAKFIHTWSLFLTHVSLAIARELDIFGLPYLALLAAIVFDIRDAHYLRERTEL